MSDLDWQCFWFEMWEVYDGGSNAKFQQNITNPPTPPPPPTPVFESTLTGQAPSTFLVICQFFQKTMRMWVLRLCSLLAP